MACCKNSGFKKLWLTVNSKNEPAIKFYKKHGFYEVGVTNFELGGERHENRVFHKSIL
ncbi:GNAT family N-acetyltransferase [bacterium SCSIO 12696]|nr:GNAT family N-acetyltransferase [bacterium SCSIO 12696]